MRPRRNFVRQHPPVRRHEHFDGQQTHKVQPLHHRQRHGLRRRRRRLGNAGGGEGQVEYVVAVVVFDGIERRHGAVRAARHDHADFAGEVNKALQYQWFRKQS